MRNNSILNTHRVVQAGIYSFSGLRWLLANEAAFRQEVAFFTLLLIVSGFLGFDSAAMAIQVGLMSLVLVVEALNTAIEKLVDRVSLDRHPLSGVVKDIGSAAVVLSFIPLVIFWVGSLLA